MRVGLDYRPALLNREGIGRYTRELVRALVELGFGAQLGLFGWTLAARRYADAELGLAGSAARLSRQRFPSRWLPQLFAALGRGADDFAGGADVFHHTQLSFLPVRAATEVATIFDCIYLHRDAGYLSPAAADEMTAAARRLVPRVQRVLVPCAFVGAEVVAALGADPARVSVTGLGCDHVLRHMPPGPLERPRDPYVLTVSRIDPRKNHARMLAAFERLVRDGLPHRWVVAGPDGWRCEEFERALERSPARARVEWRPFVRDAELPALYAGADAFLFASLNEGFGLPPLEAMACGAPVVASAVTSLPEVLGDAALLVDPTDADAIFEAARSILTAPALADDLRRRGRERARRFTWQECARQTLAAYEIALRTPV